MTESDPDDGIVDPTTVRRGYDEIAEEYDDARSVDGIEADRLAAFVDALDEGARVLDAGCGGGDPVLRRLSGAVTAVGLDVARGQLDLASEAAPEARLVQSDLSRLPLADDTVDGIVALHSLIHVPLDAHSDAIEEFARVLAPGGRLLLTEGLGEWQGSNPDWLDTGTEMQWEIAGEDATRGHLRAAGFEIEECWDTDLEFGDDDERWLYFEATWPGDR